MTDNRAILNLLIQLSLMQNSQWMTRPVDQHKHQKANVRAGLQANSSITQEERKKRDKKRKAAYKAKMRNKKK